MELAETTSGQGVLAENFSVGFCKKTGEGCASAFRLGDPPAPYSLSPASRKI